MTNSLKEQLEKTHSGFTSSVPQDVQNVISDGIKALTESDLIKKVIQKGQKAPDFTLINSVGKKINLYDELKKGRVILTWYRGGWCPYCNLQLQYMQQSLPIFKELGSNFIALTPEKPDSSLSTKEKNELEFEVLSDIDSTVAKSYGLTYKLTNEVSDLYKNTFSLDLAEYNENNSDELPIPATYIINQDATVEYAYINADYTKRAEPADIINELKK
tara:strand:+ start:5881 stop:6531 length:651 start_codon:yes stop_codon:yes gene_type:complete